MDRNFTRYLVKSAAHLFGELLLDLFWGIFNKEKSARGRSSFCLLVTHLGGITINNNNNNNNNNDSNDSNDNDNNNKKDNKDNGPAFACS